MSAGNSVGRAIPPHGVCGYLVKSRTSVVILLAAMTWVSGAFRSQAASFDCGRVSTEIEKTICADRTLSDLDDALTKLYAETKQRLSGADQDQLVADQKEWLKHRNVNCSFGDVAGCLLGSYQIRMEQLAPPRLADPNADIIDVAAKWGFSSVEGLYWEYSPVQPGGTSRPDGHVVVCVKTKDQQYAWWNPITDELSGPLRQNCRLDSNHRRTATDVRPDPANTKFSTPNLFSPPPLAGFAGAKHIWVEFKEIKDCPAVMWPYIKVERADGVDENFYIFSIKTKQSTDNLFRDIVCGGSPHDFYRDFTHATDIESVDIGNGRSLILKNSLAGGEGILLLVSNLPKTLWSSRGKIFVFSGPVFLSALEAGRSNYSAIYQALLSTVGRYPPK